MKHIPISELQRAHHQCNVCSFAPFCLSENTGEKPASTPQVMKQGITLSPKQQLVSSGTPLQSLYIVNSGFLVAYHLETDGSQKIVQFYFPGEILGFEAFSDGKYPYHIYAGNNAVICQAFYEGLLHKIADEPPLQRQLLKLVSARLRKNILFTSTLAEEKLLNFFKELALRLHYHGATPEFTLPMTRQDIGNYLGLAGETVSRLLSRLQSSKKIILHHKKIKIL